MLRAAMELARRRLGGLGKGLEIGGSALNPFPGVRCFNLDAPGHAVFARAQGEIAGRVAPIDLLASAERLPVASSALPFLLNSHVLEHLPDTIRALLEWDRVLRRGGLLFSIVPHRLRTDDRLRPRTELRHHLADFALGTTVATDALVPTSHYHVWEPDDLLALIDHLRAAAGLDWELLDVEPVDSKVGNGFTVVARKRGIAPPLPVASADAPIDFHQWTLELPFQVVQRTLERIVPGERMVEPPGLPRGTYRVDAIRGGFPPVVASSRRVAVGPELPAPEIVEAQWQGTRLLLRGRHLTATTYLEATFPDGTFHRVLPLEADGALSIETAGLPLPPVPIPVAPVNLPPGGGRGRAFAVAPRPCAAVRVSADSR